MAGDGILQLEMVDVYGNALREPVDIALQHQTLSERHLVKGKKATKKITIKNLRGAPQGRYSLFIDPPSYLPVSRFVNLKASGATEVPVTFAVDPDKIILVKFPEYIDLPLEVQGVLEKSRNVLGFQNKIGDELYQALDEIRRAGLLNIAAKSAAVALTNGRTVLSYFQELREVRGDRFFVAVPHELREETKNSMLSGLFQGESGREWTASQPP